MVDEKVVKSFYQLKKIWISRHALLEITQFKYFLNVEGPLYFLHELSVVAWAIFFLMNHDCLFFYSWIVIEPEQIPLFKHVPWIKSWIKCEPFWFCVMSCQLFYDFGNVYNLLFLTTTTTTSTTSLFILTI